MFKNNMKNILTFKISPRSFVMGFSLGSSRTHLPVDNKINNELKK